MTLEMQVDSTESSTRLIAKWQAIPLGLIALAWADAKFKHEFLQRPTDIIRSSTADFPEEVTFCVVENTPELCHLVLPFRSLDSYEWDYHRIRQQLEKEICNTRNLDYGLPVNIIAKAFTDFAFRKTLILDPKETLQEEGYAVDPDSEYFVHENTEQTYHFVLPVNKWENHDIDAEELKNIIQHDIGKSVLH